MFKCASPYCSDQRITENANTIRVSSSEPRWFQFCERVLHRYLCVVITTEPSAYRGYFDDSLNVDV